LAHTAPELVAVDFGTSNTVAILRQPGTADRPLLFSGLPVLSSAVYLDADGAFHTGQEARMLAQVEPALLEPHPKQRIDDGTVLLGEREVPVLDIVASVLGRVREAADEACGTAPPVVLTHPAGWGRRRIAVLTDAAGRAGLSVASLVPEPVAAACRLGTIAPIDPTRPVCVFDFGAGTLDVAVLRPASDAGWVVAAQGGQVRLGGIDLDHALVEHLGRLVAERHPQVWERLSAPATATDRRDRSRLWEEIRGAKEMLSRASVAPVTLPGVETALHLTRGELEEVAAPLVDKAVAHAATVIARAGTRPEDLGGLFLVGGASRTPLIARLLHQRLGIAPTVLEQPELVVAAGAFDAPTPASPPSKAPAGPDTTSEEPEAVESEPEPPPRPRRARWRIATVAAAAVIALGLMLAVGIPGLWDRLTGAQNGPDSDGSSSGDAASQDDPAPSREPPDLVEALAGASFGDQIGPDLPGFTTEDEPVLHTAEVDGRHLLLALWNEGIGVWDLDSGEVAGSYTGHAAIPFDASIVELTDGPAVASISPDSIHLWSIDTFEPIRTIEIGPDEFTAAAFTQYQGRPVAVWAQPYSYGYADLSTGAVVAGHSAADSGVAGFCASRDNDRLLATFWGITTGQYHRRVVDVDTSGEVSSSTATAMPNPILWCDPDLPIAAFDELGGALEVWNLATAGQVGERVRHPTGAKLTAASVFESDGANYAVTGHDDGTAAVWDLQSGELLGNLLAAHAGPVNAVSVFLVDGEPIAATGGNGEVRLWYLDVSAG
jgi:hypothetical protein